ncbi:AtpZ/AtpI family protein [Halalkalibacterium halodurans]|uniref:AtpZ/AtpI family protein n=1 Tax=Halalkalibacterium halodurans TaxID=86665 RepID=UPI002E21D3A3|nr:AtpZ/AtpI family protein [Halalkalibacterium halodurans]
MPPRSKSPWRAIGLVSVISSYIVGGVVTGMLIGRFLDNMLGTEPILLILFLLLGLGSGFYGVFKVAQPYLGDDDS